jgi:hypothetical protein
MYSICVERGRHLSTLISNEKNNMSTLLKMLQYIFVIFFSGIRRPWTVSGAEKE